MRILLSIFLVFVCVCVAETIQWGSVYTALTGSSTIPSVLSSFHPDFKPVLKAVDEKNYVDALDKLADVLESMSKTLASVGESTDNTDLQRLTVVLREAAEVPTLITDVVGLKVCGENIFDSFKKIIEAFNQDDTDKFVEALLSVSTNLFSKTIPKCATELGQTLTDAMPDILIKVGELIGTPISVEQVECMKDAYSDFDKSVSDFANAWESKKKDSQVSFTSLAAGFKRLQQEGAKCNAPVYADIFGLLMSQAVQQVSRLVTDSLAVFSDVDSLVEDYKAKNWDNFVTHLGNLCGHVLPLIDCDSKGCQAASTFLNVVNIFAHDFAKCKGSFTKMETYFTTAESKWTEGEYQNAIVQVERGISEFGNGLDVCGLTDIAASIGGTVEKLADATVKFVHSETKVVISDLDITADVVGMFEAIRDDKWDKFGINVANLVVALLSRSCTTDYCKATISLFKELGTVIGDLDKCAATINKSASHFSSAYKNWLKKDYKVGVENVMGGIVDLGNAMSDCDVTGVASLLVNEGKTLKNAKIEKVGEEAKVVLNGVEITATVASLIESILENKPANMGKAIAKLLTEVKNANCTSSFCIFVNDLLTSARLIVPDLPKCEADIGGLVDKFTQAKQEFDENNTHETLLLFADIADEVAEASIDCHLDDVAKFLQAQGEKLRSTQIERIANNISLFVEGAVVYDSIYLLFDAVEDFDMKAIGKQLGRLIKGIKNFGCDTHACLVITSVLQTFEDVIVDLGPCQSYLESSWSEVEMAMDSFSKNEYAHGLHELGEGVSLVAKSLHKCHVPELAGDLAALAGLLKVAKLENLDFEKGWDIVVAGASIIDDIHTLVIGHETNDASIIGRAISDILRQLITLSKELCDEGDKACLVGTGILKTIVSIPNIGACIEDFKEIYNSVLKSIGDAQDEEWKHAAKDLGSAVHYLSLALHDCDAEEIALALISVAEKLGVPGLGWVETAVKLFIDGIDLIDAFRALVEAFEADPISWLSVGITVGQVVRIILRDLTDIPGLFGEIDMAYSKLDSVNTDSFVRN